MTEDRAMLARRLLQNYDAARDDLACLAPRQREVITYAAKGCDMKSSAALMGLSVPTVAAHRIAALRKLKRSMAECIALAAVAGWV
jgi:DNA-binding NarL/FixJ family response regulator